jgi:hypothetical protein
MQALVPAPGRLGGSDFVVGQEEAAVKDAGERQHRQGQQQRCTGHAVKDGSEPGGDDPTGEYPPSVDAGLPDHFRVSGMLRRYPNPEGHGRTVDRGQYQGDREHQG